jgi:predicted O-methyltransferase YrrM
MSASDAPVQVVGVTSGATAVATGDSPDRGRKTAIRRDQGEYLCEFLRSRTINRTLETGFAYGCSAAYILSGTNAPHIAIDPYAHEYGDLGLENIAKLGFRERLQLIRQPSHLALPQLAAAAVSIDFAFIDGGHKFEEIFIDWYYASLLLNVNGCIVLDDTWLEATRMTASFIRNNRKEFREIAVPAPNLFMFEKVGKDESDWTQFRRFSTT